jgi:thiaminase
MKNEKIYKKWTDFINDPKYKKHLQNSEDDWYDSLNQVIQYININNKKPYKTDNNIYSNLCTWIYSQTNNYKNKKQIMKNEEIYKKWTEFINDPIYKKYL